MRQFRYNVNDLIDEVKRHPCIWDKNCESYKDKVERRCAWEEVFNTLEENFESMNTEERRLVEEQVVTKWTNIRDTFNKSLKPKAGRPRHKYLHHDELSFLITGTPQEDLAQELKHEDYSVGEEFLLVKDEESSEDPETTTRKRSRKSKAYLKKLSKSSDAIDENNYSGLTNEFVTCDGANDARLMNEDEAFFASLLPTVVRYTVEERLDFRMEVLNVMKRIHSRRN